MRIQESDIKDLHIDVWYKYQIFNFVLSHSLKAVFGHEDLIEIHYSGKVYEALVLTVDSDTNKIKVLVKKEVV